MNKYIVYIPSYEVTIEARDEIDAYDRAIQQISYEDLKISMVMAED